MDSSLTSVWVRTATGFRQAFFPNGTISAVYEGGLFQSRDGSVYEVKQCEATEFESCGPLLGKTSHNANKYLKYAHQLQSISEAG